MLGTEGFMRPVGGAWRKTQIDPRSFEVSRTRDQLLIENLSKAKDEDVKLLGQEDLDGSPSLVYQYGFSGAPGLPVLSQTKVWVGASDGMPHRVEMNAGASHEGTQLGIKQVTTYSDYNSDFRVEAPM